MPEIECEIVVVGGGTGGVAAALAAARRSRSVCLVEETDWLGGQLTSQGVSALDEHDLIEGFGGTASYYGLRELIRDHYADLGLLRGDGGGNPGSCWVSAPRVRACGGRARDRRPARAVRRVGCRADPEALQADRPCARPVAGSSRSPCSTSCACSSAGCGRSS